MKKTILIIIILSLISCDKEIDVKALKTIESQKIRISNLKKSTDSLTKELIELKKREIKSIFTIDSLKLGATKIIDEFWKRTPLFVSSNENEKLYYAKVKILNNETWSYFMGVKFPLGSDSIYANIYELNNKKKLHLIDSIKLSIRKSTASVGGDFHFQDFMMRQVDNLILTNDKLYFFEENDDVNQNDSYNQIMSKRNYFVYELGSEKKAMQTNEKMYSNSLYYGSSAYRSVINSNKTILATTDNYIISFYNIINWEKTFKDLYSSKKIDFYNYTQKLPKSEFIFENYFKPPSLDNKYGIRLDPNNKQEIFFGDMCWHYEKDILYFDNSGYDYRCIWEANITEKKVKKIVPEHNAIHPFFFKIINNEYIAYTEDNKIMIAESPKNIQ